MRALVFAFQAVLLVQQVVQSKAFVVSDRPSSAPFQTDSPTTGVSSSVPTVATTAVSHSASTGPSIVPSTIPFVGPQQETVETSSFAIAFASTRDDAPTAQNLEAMRAFVESFFNNYLLSEYEIRYPDKFVRLAPLKLDFVHLNKGIPDSQFNIYAAFDPATAIFDVCRVGASECYIAPPDADTIESDFGNAVRTGEFVQGLAGLTGSPFVQVTEARLTTDPSRMPTPTPKPSSTAPSQGAPSTIPSVAGSTTVLLSALPSQGSPSYLPSYVGSSTGPVASSSGHPSTVPSVVGSQGSPTSSVLPSYDPTLVDSQGSHNSSLPPSSGPSLVSPSTSSVRPSTVPILVVGSLEPSSSVLRPSIVPSTVPLAGPSQETVDTAAFSIAFASTRDDAPTAQDLEAMRVFVESFFQDYMQDEYDIRFPDKLSLIHI